MGAKERTAVAGLLGEGEGWSRVLEKACPQALKAVEEA